LVPRDLFPYLQAPFPFLCGVSKGAILQQRQDQEYEHEMELKSQGAAEYCKAYKPKGFDRAVELETELELEPGTGGVCWSGLEWIGVGWSGLECVGVCWSVLECVVLSTTFFPCGGQDDSMTA
jgi:hypothetical protein